MTDFIVTKNDADVLKNFSAINDSIIFRKGSVVKTVNKANDIFAQYTLQGGSFDKDYFIYFLKDFIYALKIFPEPYLTFDEDGSKIYVNSDEPKAFVKYVVSDFDLVPPNYKTYSQKDIDFPNPDVCIGVTAQDIKTWKAVASNYSLEKINIYKEAGSNKVSVTLGKGKANNSYTQVYASNDIDSECNLNLNANNLLFHPGDYILDISNKKICRWTNNDMDLTYFVSLF